ncbi:DNA repair protein recN, ABC transporter [Prochlorococcus marinus str. MIT 9211]|uniref:DNA repair protein RecN n=1 Tax=Prochlorococcus marinus (strain MIT 9211) TaxID=93059 RepID=A9BDS0_PROM4|nr:DNA repair protein recN, ABC transporter [Prochlorococcus marinus str. MIT 9211]
MVTLIAVLAKLRIKNIGLIDSLELSFQKGFTVFTGETGAGKSILLDAIDLLLGGNPVTNSSRILSVDSDFCSIEGFFKPNSLVNSWLKKNNFNFEKNELSISREWKLTDGKWKSRFQLNCQVVSRQYILGLRPFLADLTAQGSANKLSSLTNQLKWIDKLGANEIDNALSKVKLHWNEWKLLSDKLTRARSEYENIQNNYRKMQNTLEELEMAGINDPSEDLNLKQEEDRLVHGVRLQESLCLLFNSLKESMDNSPTALDSLSLSVRELKCITELDNSLRPQLDQVLDLYTNLQVLINDLDQYYSLLESDPNQLNKIQERRVFLKDLKSKYNRDLQQLILYREQLRESLNNEAPDIALELLEQHEKNARIQRDKSNADLSQLRRKVANNFEITLIEHMQLLGLSTASFQVQINSTLPSDNGSDQVNFLFSANPGQPLSPLVEIASGGEISRFLLALKAILAQVDGSSILIFDEIDTGVSGRVSSAVANLLKEISLCRQVFCVTHQPLIAAVADHHFSISKVLINGSNRSKVHQLKAFQERQAELAELAGGDFAEASIYAASLLEKKAA